MQTEPRVPGEHEGAKLRSARPEWKEAHTAVRLAPGAELPACCEHSGTHLACSFLVLLLVAAADSAAAVVGVPMALPRAPVL